MLILSHAHSAVQGRHSRLRLLRAAFLATAVVVASGGAGDSATRPVSKATAQTVGEPGGLAASASPVGAFTNSVPITVPSFHGLEPHVSLEYDSSAGNGEAGVGWRLSAGSSIVRSGVRGSLPQYDARDVFLVDGIEMVACAPDCPTGGTHETRQQSFERFVFDGTDWTRWRRDGVKLIYEASDASPDEAYLWSLARVVDTHGNTVNYAYACVSHCYPDIITYAASTAPCDAQPDNACKPGAVIQFFYETRPDVVSYPTGRDTRQIRQRLRTVSVRMDNQLVGAYSLSYAVSGSTGNSVLRSVQQFASDADVSPDGTVHTGPTPPFPAVTFSTPSMSMTQQAWVAGSSNAPLTITSPPGNPDFPPIETSVPGAIGRTVDGEPAPSRTPLYGDFDGDRRIDVASWQASLPCSQLSVRLASNPNGRPAETLLGFAAGCRDTGFSTDLNGDGADDIVLMNQDGDIKRAISKRNGTFAIESGYTRTPWRQVGSARQCAVGDLNGDDLGDLICVYLRTGSPLRLAAMEATPDDGWLSWDIPLPISIASMTDVLLATGDVDASTTSDIMLAVAADRATWQLLTGYTAPDGSLATWSTTDTTWFHDREDEWRLSIGDFDGDARSDYALILNDATVYIAISEKGSPSRLVPQPLVATGYHNVVVGDTDGDGRSDLLIGNPVGVLQSNGDGSFATFQSFGTSRSCDLGVAAAGDVNGDGQADLLCSTEGFSPGPGGRPQIDLWLQPTPVAPTPAHRWASFDQNGDGRQDLYTVHYRNPGYEVYTLLAQPNGGYVPDHKPIMPEAAQGCRPSLTNPDAATWIPIDTGGPDGLPDGKTDLVLVEDVGSRMEVTTLLSTGSGWTVKCATPWQLDDQDVPFSDADHAWYPAELNGDGKTDLVHFRSLGPGVRVDYLLSNGDGTWTASTSNAREFFTSGSLAGGPFTRSDVGSFRLVDLNSDGLTDFVHVEVGGGPSARYSTIRSLVSTGPAAWREEPVKRFQPIDLAAAHRLQATDFDGDGLPDLARAVVLGGCVRIEGYLRTGQDWSTLRTAGAETPCGSAAGLEDLRNLVLADVNHDGKADVLRLARAGSGINATNTISTLLNPGDFQRPWLWFDQSVSSVPHADSWAWIGLDTDHDGVSELAHIGGAASANLTTLRWITADDRLTYIDNGRGAHTSITYGAQAEARTYLPPSLLPIVVHRVSIEDAAYDPPLQATATFAYDGAQWSTQFRQMAGFARIRSNQGKSAVVDTYDLSDECRTRRASTSIESGSAGVFSRTQTQFLPAGATAPFICLPANTIQAECELTTACVERVTAYTYDA
jgi:hypothetical protein